MRLLNQEISAVQSRVSARLAGPQSGSQWAPRFGGLRAVRPNWPVTLRLRVPLKSAQEVLLTGSAVSTLMHDTPVFGMGRPT